MQYKSRQRHQGLVVENVAGPMALKEAVDTYHRHLDSDDQRSDVAILEPGVVYPIDWSVKRHGQVPHICDWGGHQDVFNASACIAQHHPHAYSVQWWTHSWGWRIRDFFSHLGSDSAIALHMHTGLISSWKLFYTTPAAYRHVQTNEQMAVPSASLDPCVFETVSPFGLNSLAPDA